jgi:hypothetical protein
MEKIAMFSRTTFGLIVMLCFMMNINYGHAGSAERIQQYFSDAACKVQATADPAQKREILAHSLQTMSKALDRVQSVPVISQDDRDGLKRFQAALQEKQDELAGANGFERVSDAQLNAFSNYVVQDMEQASKVVTFSTLSLVLIAVVVVLLLVM